MNPLVPILGSLALIGSASKVSDPFEGTKPMTWFDYFFRDTKLLPQEKIQPGFASEGWGIWGRQKRIVKETADIVIKLLDTPEGELLRQHFESDGSIEANDNFSFIAYLLTFDWSIPAGIETIKRVRKEIKKPSGSVDEIISVLNYTRKTPLFRMILTQYINWSISGKNIIVVGEEMQKMFENTSLRDVTSQELGLPNNGSVYIALPNFNGRLYGNMTEDLNSPIVPFYIRGVLLTRFIEPRNRTEGLTLSDYTSQTRRLGSGRGVLKISFWCKGRLDNQNVLYDHWLDENVPDQESLETILDQLRVISGDPTNPAVFKQPQESKESMILAARIAINTVMYWRNMGDRVDLVHPFLKELYEKIEVIQKKMAETKFNSKRWRGLNGNLQGLLNQIAREGNWSYIDPPLPKSTGTGESRGMLGKTRMSPTRHINRAHWRTIRVAGGTKKIFISPYWAGSRVPVQARYLTSVLDKYDDIRKKLR